MLIKEQIKMANKNIHSFAERAISQTRPAAEEAAVLLLGSRLAPILIRVNNILFKSCLLNNVVRSTYFLDRKYFALLLLTLQL